MKHLTRHNTLGNYGHLKTLDNISVCMFQKSLPLHLQVDNSFIILSLKLSLENTMLLEKYCSKY